jgi:hypothetical protein
MPVELRSAASMAIGAAHLALLHLGVDRFPATLPPDQIGYVVSLLSSNMVKIEHDWVGLAAVYTRVGTKILI